MLQTNDRHLQSSSHSQSRTIGQAFRSDMKPVERVLAVMRRQEPDRVPHFEWAHTAPFIKQIGARDYFELIDMLDVDAVDIGARYRKKPVGNGASIDEWGATRQLSQEGYPIVIDELARIKTLSDLKDWEPPDPDDPFRFSDIEAAVQRFGGNRAIILQMRDVFSGPRDYIGYADALINMIDCPQLIVGVVAKCVDHYIRIIQRAADIGVDCVVTGDDIADSRGPLFSPRIWNDLLLPHYKRLVEAIHDAGLYHWKHSDGNIYPFLESIVDTGTDGIDPIDPMGGMSLAVVKARYGDRVALKGNVDQVDLLRRGSPEQVVETVKSCIREAGIGGGYVCSSSNTIHGGVSPALYRVMVEAIHTYGRYPLDLDMLAPNPEVMTAST